MSKDTHPLAEVDVLMPTLCSAGRRSSIERAIQSVLSQAGCIATPVLVVNGTRYDPAFRQHLEGRADLRVHYLPEPDLFRARQFARRSVTAPFFSWLDDDDIYLPGALGRRLDLLLSDASLDAVVSNGWISEGGGLRALFPDASRIERDPIGALLERNWLAAAGGLYRTSSIDESYFDASVRSLDMTFLAFRLALEKRLAFVAEPTFRKNRTPGSISSTAAWMIPAADVLQRMAGFPLEPRHQRALLRKLSAARHSLSDYHRHEGRLGPAWKAHLLSLSGPGALLRYGGYTRHLLALALRRAIGLDAPSDAEQASRSRRHGNQ